MKESIKLKKEYAQFEKKNTGKLESALIITVMYRPDTNEVEYVDSVQVYNYHTGTYTDISAIMGENLEDMLNDMVDSISWKEEWRNSIGEEGLLGSMEDTLENTSSLHPVFETIFNNIRR